MLAAALQAEVAAYVEQFRDEVDEAGHRLVVRNGYHAPREMTTAAGAVPVKQPRVNDKRIDKATGERKRFSSAAYRCTDLASPTPRTRASAARSMRNKPRKPPYSASRRWATSVTGSPRVPVDKYR